MEEVLNIRERIKRLLFGDPETERETIFSEIAPKMRVFYCSKDDLQSGGALTLRTEQTRREDDIEVVILYPGVK